MPKTAVVIGSPKYDRSTTKLIKNLQIRTKCDEFFLSDYRFKDTKGQPAINVNKTSDDFFSLVDKLSNYSHIVFATSVYSYTQNKNMNVFFDRLCEDSLRENNKKRLFGKNCSVLSTGLQSEFPRYIEDVLRLSFDYVGMCYKGVTYCQCEPEFQTSRHAIRLNAFASALKPVAI